MTIPLLQHAPVPARLADIANHLASGNLEAARAALAAFRAERRQEFDASQVPDRVGEEALWGTFFEGLIALENGTPQSACQRVTEILARPAADALGIPPGLLVDTLLVKVELMGRIGVTVEFLSACETLDKRMGFSTCAQENLPELFRVLARARALLEEPPLAGFPREWTDVRRALLLRYEGIACRRESPIEVDRLLLERSLEALDRSADLFARVGLQEDRVISLVSKAITFKDMGEFAREHEVLEEALAVARALGDPLLTGWVLQRLGIHFFYGGASVDSTIRCFKQSLTLFRDHGNRAHAALTEHFIGRFLIFDKAEITEGLKYLRSSRRALKAIGDHQSVGWSYYRTANAYDLAGELDRALHYYDKSLAYFKEHEELEGMAHYFSKIGGIYHYKGELTEALSNYNKSLALFERLVQNLNMGEVLGNIARIYQSQGKPDEARTFFERAEKLLRAGGDNYRLAWVLYNLISGALAGNQLEAARRHLADLEAIRDKVGTKALGQVYRLAKALVLKSQPRFKHKFAALHLLEEIGQEEVTRHEITVDAMLNACDLLILELRVSGQPPVLQEVKAVTKRLLAIGETHHSFSLLAETYLLQSKLALVELKLPKARRLLARAQNIADEKGLHLLAQQISDEYDALLEETTKWEELAESGASLEQRLELANLEETMDHLVQQRDLEGIDQEDEQPVLFLVLNEAGITVYSKRFESAAPDHPDDQIDEILVGSFLSAINSFMREAFSSEGFVERIKHQEYTLLMKVAEPILFCYVLKGPSYRAVHKVAEIVETIHARPVMWESLQRVGRVLDKDEHARVEAVVTRVISGASVTEEEMPGEEKPGEEKSGEEKAGAGKAERGV